MAFDVGIINGFVYLDGEFRKVNLYIKNEKIGAVSAENLECNKVVDAEGKYVFPGFIDPHVHFALGVGANISKDDFEKGSIEAALGGVTTYIDFLDPVKESCEIEKEFQKRKNLAEKSYVDYSFHTTIANPKASPESIIRKSKEFGINSIKLFTTYADTDRRTYDDYIYNLLEASVDEKSVIVVHAENDDLILKNRDYFIF